MHPVRCAATVLLMWAGTGCASRPTPAPPAGQPLADTTAAPAAPAAPAEAAGALPPVPLVRGRLALRVGYPAPNAVVQARDSTFLFGSVGTGEARLSIDGTPVRVHPNGAWLAWLPLTADSLTAFRLLAWTPAESVAAVFTVRRAGWRPSAPGALWIDSTSMAP